MSKTLEQNNKVFGFQMLLDLYGCKPGACDDLALCYKFLDETVTDLGMEKQSPPNIFRSDELKFPDKAGLSGWVPLIESSIVIHTLTPKDFITIDIYCCKSFSLEMAREKCRKFFAPKKMDEQYIERGQDYFKSDSNYHTLTVDKTDPKHSEVVVQRKEAVASVK